MTEETPFKIRSYSKAELAMLYNPTQCITVALKTLSRWIQAHPDLIKELEEMKYNKYRRSFTPKEVSIIIRYLGIP